MAEQEVVNYMAKFGIDSSEFVGGIEKMGSSFMAAFGPAGMVIGAVAAASTAIGLLISNQGQLAKSNIELGEMTGVSTDAIQRFHYAALLSSDSIGMVDTMINRLSMNMGKAADATSTQAKAFAELGMNVEGKTVSDVFVDLATKLTTMQDKTRAAALSQDILGRSYKESVPYMRDYLKNIDEINSKQVFTDEQEKQLEKGADAYAKLGASAARAQAIMAIIASSMLFPENTTGVAGSTTASLGGTNIFGAGKFSADALYSMGVASKPPTDPYSGMNEAQYKLLLLTTDRADKEKIMTEALRLGSDTAAKVAKDFHDADFALQAFTKTTQDSTRAENVKLNAAIAKGLGVSESELVLNADGTPQKWAGGQYKIAGETSAGISGYGTGADALKLVTSDANGQPIVKGSAQDLFNQYLVNGGKASDYTYQAPSGANADAQWLQQFGQQFYFGNDVKDSWADLRVLSRDIGKKDLAGDYKSQGPSGWNWNYDNNIANQLRAAYQKGLEGMAAQGITIINNNNGYATPAEIQAATAKAVSEALAKQVTS